MAFSARPTASSKTSCSDKEASRNPRHPHHPPYHLTRPVHLGLRQRWVHQKHDGRLAQRTHYGWAKLIGICPQFFQTPPSPTNQAPAPWPPRRSCPHGSRSHRHPVRQHLSGQCLFTRFAHAQGIGQSQQVIQHRVSSHRHRHRLEQRLHRLAHVTARRI